MPAWRAFLRRLDGVPELIVSDSGLARKAAGRVWPLPGHVAPELRRCEWHLARNITRSLPDDVQRDRAEPIHRLITAALSSVQGWEALTAQISARACAGGYLSATKTLASLDQLVRDQITTRTPTGPHFSGALEQFFHHLDATIGDRAARLTNKARADALLQLLAADRNGWADETAWAELIRQHLLTRRGRAPEQRRCTDSSHDPSLRAPLPRPAIVDF